MQRVIQRTTAARKQAQQKILKNSKKPDPETKRQQFRAQVEYNKALAQQKKDAVKNRREDWIKGPLAPKRDSGLEVFSYGGVSPQLVQPPPLPKHKRRKHVLFAPGDRVCVVNGKEKGKISEISGVKEEEDMVFLKNTNMADVAVPDWMQTSMGIKSDIVTNSLPIPIDDIRHVIALQDPKTGLIEDWIVEHAYAAGPFVERHPDSTTPKFTRYVLGEDIEIPWPVENIPPAKDGQWDTTRMEADTDTWVPSLAHPPFPSSIIDELRNKFSKFRTRHDPEYVRLKVEEDYRRQYYESRTMLTPIGEWRAKRQAESAEAKKNTLDADGNVIMDKETSEFIESWMARKKEGQSAQ
ncbi:hypothetical protein N7510_002256 [Penicillium lagena]|uniref:uncharacterized protein n=1 Tax=Penicillium lagena TaxID=94218 RepID=UPI0025416CBB|nr:uncharacterized protein N7510_002256 [Penicillium lagena]KAJ5625947.1 hypothetical protein N7510_002256 [Penicillium lagena]